MTTFALAIDFGGTKTLCGLVDASGVPLAVRRFETDGGAAPQAHFARCSALLRECLAETGLAAADAAGLGVTVPGLADAAAGVLRYAPHSGWRGVQVGALLAAEWPELARPAAVANDVNACALAEMRFGRSAGCRSSLWVTVSTGIGGGLVLDGRLYEGEHGIAGEIGHLPVEWERPNRCGCGASGCLEAHASGTAIAAAAERIAFVSGGDSRLSAYMRERRLTISAASVAAAARDGVPEAMELYRRAGMYLGRALASAANLLNPGCIVIGGGVSLSLDLLLPALEETFRAAVIGDENRAVRIEPTALGYEAGLKGAASLAFAAAGM